MKMKTNKMKQANETENKTRDSSEKLTPQNSNFRSSSVTDM